MAKNPPDLVARATAVVGTVLGLVGLWLSYNNYRWQRATYEESLQERILIRLSASFKTTTSSEPPTAPFGSFSKVKLGIEVTNIGLHPIYLRSVMASLGGPPFDGKTPHPMLTLYEHATGNEPMPRLEPDEAKWFVAKDVDFSEFPFDYGSEVWARVETTTRSFVQQVHLDSFTIYGDVAGWSPPKRKAK